MNKVYTYDEYINLNENNIELIEGKLLTQPDETYRHIRIILELSRQFTNYFEENKEFEILCKPTILKLVESDTIKSVTKPSMIIKCKDSHVDKENMQNQLPNIVIELILDEATKENEMKIKKNLYEKYKIPEYWIVDPFKDIVEIHKLIRDKYVTSEKYESNMEIKVDIFKKLKISLKELFYEDMNI